MNLISRPIDEDKLLRCHVCEAVNIDDPHNQKCYRCDSELHLSKEPSTSVSWALLITAIIFYIPANFYPILQASTYGYKTTNTIIGGVAMLWMEGSYPVAVVILVASVIVPILKFIVIIYLLISTRAKKKTKKINQHSLYYLVETIGPWSMVDVFVVSVLTGLVHMTSIEIIAGPGATAFVLMVIFTMFSALSIDSRLFRQRKIS